MGESGHCYGRRRASTAHEARGILSFLMDFSPNLRWGPSTGEVGR